ncbi:glycoside hydrolase family 61 protein G [Gloeopeniophorella convolvens]|nr:glycoside hydrolase family 61 protein G [Gloeopeniophorella convolvens]
MKSTFAKLASVAILASSVSAKTVFSAMNINGVYQGLYNGVRTPSSDNAILDITSDNLICNSGFIQPVSSTVLTVPAGSSVSAIFHHTSAGYTGPDPADPIDPTNKGPLTAYLAAVPSATQTDVTGLKWFKIWEDGFNTAADQWGSDRLYINGGNATFTIPSCIPSGQYLLRVEDIALQMAQSSPGAQFYLSCAQIEVTGGGSAKPATVSIPGVYTPDTPGITIANVYNVDTYTVPGPAPFTC